MRRRALILALFSGLAFLHAEARVAVWDKDASCGGYILWQDKVKCQLMDRAGTALYNFPGILAVLPPGDGSVIAQVGGSLVDYEADLDIRWRVEAYVDHEVCIGPDGDVLFLSADRVPMGSGTIRFDSIGRVGRDGRALSFWRTSEHYPEILAYLLKNTDALDYDDRGQGDMEKVLKDLVPGLAGIGPGPSDRELFHMNAIHVIARNERGPRDPAFRQGNLLLSFCSYGPAIRSFLAIVDPADFRFLWCYVMPEARPIHTPRILPDGSLMFYSNSKAAWMGGPPGDSAVVVIDPEDGRLLWEFRESFPDPGNLRDSHGSCQELPNGDILVSNKTGQVYEVTRDKRIVWSWHTDESGHLYRASWYAPQEVSWLLGQ